MNAMTLGPAWRPLASARRLKVKMRQRGFALYELQRRPGLPVRVANAQARFEQEAREAMRDWLLL
jgi:hypothetical protein